MDLEETSHLLAKINEKLDNIERSQALSDAGHTVRAKLSSHTSSRAEFETTDISTHQDELTRTVAVRG